MLARTVLLSGKEMFTMCVYFLSFVYIAWLVIENFQKETLLPIAEQAIVDRLEFGIVNEFLNRVSLKG